MALAPTRLKRGQFLGLISVLIWGTHAASGKFILSGGGTPWTLAALRLWLAFLVLRLVLVFLPKSKGPPFKANRAFWLCLLTGFLPNVVFFHYALKFGMAGTTMILENTAPIFALAGGAFFLRKKISWKTLASVALTVFGVQLIFLEEFKMLESGILGSTFGLLSGVTWAAFAGASEMYFEGEKPDLSGRLDFLSRILLYGGVLLLPVFFLEPIQYSTKEWAAVVYYAVAPTALALIFWNELVHVVSALSATIIFNLTIPVTLLVAWLTLGEKPTAFHLVAAVMVTAAVVLDAVGAPAEKSV